MSSIHIAEPLIEAVNVIANSVVSKAGYDKTIKATIKQLLDKPTGKYKIKYQDSQFQAYGTPDVYYQEGQQVSILIPRGDWDRTKTIIGAKPSTALTYKQVPIMEEQCNFLGPNAISFIEKTDEQGNVLDNTIKLYSQLGQYQKLLYSVTDTENNILNVKDISNYIKSGDSIFLSMVIRTDFGSHMTGGKYGIRFNLIFKNPITGENISRPIQISDTDIYGDPYQIVKAARFNCLIPDLDTQNFVRIDSIYAYCNSFPKVVETEEETTPDIFISDMTFKGSSRLTQDELNGYSLHINLPDGNMLEDGVEKIKLEAQLKVQGKLITENVKYYWFVQNGLIFRGVKGYSSFGGDGWQCLNTPQGTSGSLFVPFTSPDFYCVSSQTSETNEYKPEMSVTKILCAADYGDKTTIRGQCQIINRNINNNIYIDSSDKKQGQNKVEYFLGNGKPTLTCRIIDDNGTQITKEDNEDNYKDYNFTWIVQPANSKAINQMENDDIPKKLFTVSEDIIIDDWEIEAGKLWNLDKLTPEQLDRIKDIISENSYTYWKNQYYKKQKEKELADENAEGLISSPCSEEQLQSIQCIDRNKYINFPISSIINSTKITCAVTKNEKNAEGEDIEVYKGSASITLYNKMELEGQYSLIINNGTQIFQYDEKGNSPFVVQADRKPMQELPALSFTLLDGSGTQIAYSQIVQQDEETERSKYGSVRWLFPKDDTLLISNQGDPINNNADLVLNSTDTALAADYNIYKNQPTFSYSIEDRYSLSKTNNNIGLMVNFKGVSLEAWTDFTFPKNGDPGTNGTKLIAKIIPQNSKEDNLSTDRIYITTVNNNDIIFTDTGAKVDKLGFFVYNNNTKIYSSQNTDDNNKIFWSCPPKAIYDDNQTYTDNDLSYYSYSKTNNFKRKYAPASTQNIKMQIGSTSNEGYPVNIIRGQYGAGKDEDTKYYAEYPFCYEHILIEGHEDRYRIKVKPKTGFKYVTYAADGTRPDYDNAKPFEIIVEKHVLVEQEDGIKEGYYTKSGIDNIECTWDTIGSISVDEEKSIDLPSNQRYFKPADEFNGLDLTTAIVVSINKIKDGSNEVSNIGFIHIPIYMNLNRYGNNAINGWDGNSIDLGDTNGGTILAPQVGAGKKGNNNTFTGVLIGEEKNGSEDQVGLFGYNDGVRSIFLDANTGKAEFGKQGAAKIVLDPSQKMNNKDSAFIYSNNFNKDEYVKNNGKLINNNAYINYQKTKNQGGLMVDLTTPQIAFANGKFNVSGAGALHSESGDIAGWQITEDRLYKNNTGMSSENYKVNRPNENAGGPSSTVSDSKAFYAGTSNQPDNFYVTHMGYLYSKFGQIAGWNISEKALVKKYINTSTNPNSTITIGMNADPENGSYSGPSGHKAKAFFANGDNFYVTHDGYLRSTSGKIASWNITSDYLSNGNVGMGHQIFNDEIIKSGTNWGHKNPFNSKTAKNKSSLTPENITARYWAGSLTDIDKLVFAVDSGGKLYSRSGKIGGWNITDTMLYAGNANASDGDGIRLDTTGSINGGSSNNYNWSISENGTATFNQINATGGKIGEWTISDGAISNGNVTLTKSGAIDAKEGFIGAATITASGLKGTGWEITNSFAKFTGLQVQSDGKVQSSATGGIHGTSPGGSWSLPGSSSSLPTNDVVTPRSVKLYDKLVLKIIKPNNNDTWKMVKSTTPLGDCIDIKRGESEDADVTVSGSISVSGQDSTGSNITLTGTATLTGTVKVPTYERDLKLNYGVIDASNQLSSGQSKMVTGWHNSTSASTYTFMATDMQVQDVDENQN